MSWHLDSDTVASYRANTLTPAMAASVEAHVVACAQCRRALATHVDAQRVAQNWSAIVDQVDGPHRTRAERVLTRLGLREHTARLIVMTPTFRVAWLAAVALVSALALTASTDRVLLRGDRGSFAFLVLAPILPVLGIAAAFAPRLDPVHELTASSPISAFELLFARASAVLVSSTAISGVASLGLPGGRGAAAWLLPALGLTTATLALARWMEITVAAGTLTALWLIAAAITARSEAATELIAAYPPFRPAGQLAFLALALAAIGYAFATRRSFDFRRTA